MELHLPIKPAVGTREKHVNRLKRWLGGFQHHNLILVQLQHSLNNSFTGFMQYRTSTVESGRIPAGIAWRLLHLRAATLQGTSQLIQSTPSTTIKRPTRTLRTIVTNYIYIKKKKRDQKKQKTKLFKLSSAFQNTQKKHWNPFPEWRHLKIKQ